MIQLSQNISYTLPNFDLKVNHYLANGFPLARNDINGAEYSNFNYYPISFSTDCLMFFLQNPHVALFSHDDVSALHFHHVWWCRWCFAASFFHPCIWTTLFPLHPTTEMTTKSFFFVQLSFCVSILYFFSICWSVWFTCCYQNCLSGCSCCWSLDSSWTLPSLQA